MKIRLNLKASYGRVLAYPACDDSQRFADMLRVKTLTRDALRHIASLGYAIETDGGLRLDDVQ